MVYPIQSTIIPLNPLKFPLKLPEAKCPGFFLAPKKCHTSPAVAVERHGVVHDVVAGVKDAAVVVEPHVRWGCPSLLSIGQGDFTFKNGGTCYLTAEQGNLSLQS